MKNNTPLPQVSKWVIHALRALKHSDGCSMDSIKKYITDNYQTPGKPALNQISMAIKRGVIFGAIKKSNGHFKLDSMMAVAARQVGRTGKTAPPKKRPKKQPKRIGKSKRR